MVKAKQQVVLSLLKSAPDSDVSIKVACNYLVVQHFHLRYRTLDKVFILQTSSPDLPDHRRFFNGLRQVDYFESAVVSS